MLFEVLELERLNRSSRAAHFNCEIERIFLMAKTPVFSRTNVYEKLNKSQILDKNIHFYKNTNRFG